MNVRNRVFNLLFPNATLERFLLQRRLVGKGLSLMYHEVLPDNKGPAAWTVVKETDFKEQMLFVKKYFDVITLDEALERTGSCGPAKKPYATVTFDDGYSGNFSCVLPIIEELQLPIHVFIATQATETGELYWYDKLLSLYHKRGNLDVNLQQLGLGDFHLNPCGNEKKEWAAMQNLLTNLKKIEPEKRETIVAEIVDDTGQSHESLQMMNISELQKISQSPMVTIGGHSHCHNILPQLSDPDLRDTLAVNRKKLQDWTGQKVEYFSYPNGNYDERVIRAVKKTGYKGAVTTQGEHWLGDIFPFEIPRYGIGRFDSLGLFIARLGRLV